MKNVTYSYCVTDTVGTPMLRVGVLGLNLTIKDGEFIVLTRKLRMWKNNRVSVNKWINTSLF